MAQINSVLDTMSYVLGDKGNHIKNLTTADKGSAQNDKFFTELVLFDSQTFNKLQPFINGRGIFIAGKMPQHMEILYPKETAYFKVLTSTCIIGVNGFANETMETDEVKAATDQNTAAYVTKLTGNTTSITLTYLCEFTSLVIYNYVTTWMHLVYNPGSMAAAYCHLTGLEYHEGNHTMTGVYVVTNPSYQTVEIGAVFYGMFPTDNLQSNYLNATFGTHDIPTVELAFKVHTYTTALPNVMEVCKKTLDDYVNRTAIVDYRVKKVPTTGDFLL